MSAQVRIRPDHAAVADAPALLGWIDIEGLPAQVSSVRRQLRRLLGEDHPLLEELQLLTTEAVSNAIAHTASGAAGGRVTVRILRSAGRIRVETVDDGAPGRVPRPRHDPWAENGRGLWLIGAIAVDHGYRPGPEGGTYWFDLHWTELENGD